MFRGKNYYDRFVYTLKKEKSMGRLGRKRLAVDVPINLHNALKVVAISRNITMTRYVIRALLRYSMNETKYEDTSQLFDEFK
jgi:hypothetical protein